MKIILDKLRKYSLAKGLTLWLLFYIFDALISYNTGVFSFGAFGFLGYCLAWLWQTGDK